MLPESEPYKTLKRKGTLIPMAKPRVMILGGGFGGLYTAQKLEKLRGDKDDFDISLISKDNYFVYQPMLAEIISGHVGIYDTISPLRQLLPKTDIIVRK